MQESEEQIQQLCQELLLVQNDEEIRIKADELREAIRIHMDGVRIKLRAMKAVLEA